MTKKTKIRIEIAVIILLFVLLAVVLHQYGAEALVERVGVHNTYFIMFLVALFGGMTSVGGASYIATVLTFISGGASPLFIALAAGIGTTMGDSAYYLVSWRGHEAIGEGWLRKKIQKLSNWLESHSRVTKFAVIYAYTAFTPLPNDVLTITLGISRTSKVVVLPALLLGDLTFAFLLAYLGDALPFV